MIFICSFFLEAFNKFINLYLEIVNVLNIITAMYITAKYMHVFIQASFENTNSNLLISAANNFPTKTDINCDAKTPITKPTINEIIPTKIVSINKILEICPLLIPSIIYVPNSFFLLFIKKLFAYTIKSPNITATKTETNPSIVIINFINSLVELDTCIIASWLSSELNI